MTITRARSSLNSRKNNLTSGRKANLKLPTAMKNEMTEYKEKQC